MEYRIVRELFDKEQTIGTFTISDDKGVILFQCKTLELPWLDNASKISCIPIGCYVVKSRFSKKYSNHLHVTNVEGRSYILIHNGNYYTDILGCILVGDRLKDINKDGLKDVTNSVVTLKKLLAIVPNKFNLEIK